MILIVRGHINGEAINMTLKGKWRIFEFDLAKLYVNDGTSWACLKRPSRTCASWTGRTSVELNVASETWHWSISRNSRRPCESPFQNFLGVFEASACAGSCLLLGWPGETFYERTALNPGGSLALAATHAACSISFRRFFGSRFRTCSRWAFVSCQGPTMSIVNSQ
jgi:hypothetical protein